MCSGTWQAAQKLWFFSAETDESCEVATLLSGGLFSPCCHKSGLHQENKRDIYETFTSRFHALK